MKGQLRLVSLSELENAVLLGKIWNKARKGAGRDDSGGEHAIVTMEYRQYQHITSISIPTTNPSLTKQIGTIQLSNDMLVTTSSYIA